MITTANAASLRRRLADQLAAEGDLRSPAWRAAVEQVPREAFLGDRIYRRIDTGQATLWEPLTLATVGEAAWRALANQNETWVTQFDARDHTADGLLQGAPTSSSTLPGLVVRMLEDLDARDGHAAMEIGAGSGYSTALMCQRLGDSHVTTVEIDDAVASRARAALTTVGYTPALITGDGLAGYELNAPYDRIIATCSVRTIPPAWLAQARPGGMILVTLSGWLYGSGLAALQVTSEHSAEGRFLPGCVSFMPARPHAAPPVTSFPGRDGTTRAASYGPGILNEWMGRFLAQLAAPMAQHVHLFGTGGRPPSDLIIDQVGGSCAWLTHSDGQWAVQQHGPDALWDQIEQAYQAWQEAGSPAIEEFTVHVTPQAQTVRLDANGLLSWTLPAWISKPPE